MQTRDRLHQLIDDLPEADLPAIERFLNGWGASDDSLLRALANAPEDDEPLTPDDEAAIDEGMDAIARGDMVSSAELRRSPGW